MIKAQKIQIVAEDDHRLAVWRAEPSGASKGGIVVLHAIYGLTDHMGDVCARWAEAGFTAVAPQLYDRLSPNRVHPYDKPFDGVASYAELTEAQIFADIRAACAAAWPTGSVAISGFCTGGTWAWRAAAAMNFPAQVNFYGSAIPALLNLAPRCPTILHYGDTDIVVSVAQIAEIRARHPEVELHVYPGAGHAFENIEQSGYDAPAADLAWERSIAFMDRYVSRV